jgi:hypothetical protein
MKIKLLFYCAFIALLTTFSQAQEATIARLSGSETVTVTLPNDEDVQLGKGDVIPVGSWVEVPAAAKLFLRTFKGTTTVFSGGAVFEVTQVEETGGKEKTLLTLRSGDLVANLDPTKRGVNDYGVRTPKGVAAARGTNYSVSVNGVQVLITVSAGQVSMTIPGFPNPISVSPGQASTGQSGAAVSLASVLGGNSGNSELAKAALRATAAAVAVLASDPTSGVTTETLSQVITTVGDASKATGDPALLSQVAATAAAANPSAAAAVVTAAVKSDPASAAALVASVTDSVTKATAVTTSTSTTQGDTTTTTTTTSTPTAGAVQTLSQTLADAANAAAQSVGSTETVDATTVSQTVQSSQAATPPTTTTTTTTTAPPPSTTSTTPTPTPTTEDTTEDTVEVVEIPSDNTIVTVFSTFTIRLSDGRFVAVTVNDQNNSANVRTVSSVQGAQTTEVGNGGSTTFTVPAAVTAAVGPLNATQFTNIAAGIQAAVPGPAITVPNNTIVVSPSS